MRWTFSPAFRTVKCLYSHFPISPSSDRTRVFCLSPFRLILWVLLKEGFQLLSFAIPLSSLPFSLPTTHRQRSLHSVNRYSQHGLPPRLHLPTSSSFLCVTRPHSLHSPFSLHKERHLQLSSSSKTCWNEPDGQRTNGSSLPSSGSPSSQTCELKRQSSLVKSRSVVLQSKHPSSSRTQPIPLFHHRQSQRVLRRVHLECSNHHTTRRLASSSVEWCVPLEKVGHHQSSIRQ